MMMYLRDCKLIQMWYLNCPVSIPLCGVVIIATNLVSERERGREGKERGRERGGGRKGEREREREELLYKDTV